MNRREFIGKSAGIALGGAAGGALLGGAVGGAIAGRPGQAAAQTAQVGQRDWSSVRTELDEELNSFEDVTTYNNFYEFTEDKPSVAAYAQRFNFRPWTVEIAGLVKKPRTVDADELIRKIGQEERLYRHRCVEAWAMAVPWTGLPLSKLLDAVEPLSGAKFVRFVTYMRPKAAPGQHPGSAYPWPYHE